MSKSVMRLALGLAVLSALVVVDSSVAQLYDTAPHIPPGHNTFVPPPKGHSYIDPTFGTEVWRVTNALYDGRAFLSTEYASQSPTNADDSMVRVMASGGGVRFYSTAPPFNLLRIRGLGASSASDLWWHPTNPDVLFHLDAIGELRSYNYAADVDSLVARFPYANVQGLGENQLSLDGNRLAAAANNRTKVFVYEISSDSIIAELDTSGLNVVDVTISPDGTRVLLSNKHPGGYSDMFVYTIGNGLLNFERDLGIGYGHKDVGQSPAGDDYLLAVESYLTNEIRAVRLSDGALTVLEPIGWNTTANIAVHVSANSMSNDGWVYISTYSDQDPNPQTFWPTYFNEIFRVSFDGTVTERLVHPRARYHRPSGDTYYALPRATVSRSGRLLFFGSNMRQRVITNPHLPPDYTDTYMMYLGGSNEPSAVLLDGLGGLHNIGAPSGSLAPHTPYFGFDAAVDIEFTSTGYYMLDEFGYVHAGGGAPAVVPHTPYFGWDIARDLEVASGGGVYVLDGFGGVHTGAGATISAHSLHLGWDVAKDLELTPDGFYVLDGFGGVHVGDGASLTQPSFYIGWNIARDLELSPNGFYVLDGFGGIHPGNGAPHVWGQTPFFGYDIARDLEVAGTGFYVLDGKGEVHPGGGAMQMFPSVYFGWDIARDLELR